MKYFVAINGRSCGPYSIDEVRKMNLTADTLVWHEGLPDWVELGSIADLSAMGPNANSAGAVPPPFDPYRFGQRAGDRPNQNPFFNQNQVPPPPYSHLAEAIIVTLFCCLPFGIYAIILAARVNTLYERGEFDLAQQTSKKALKWVMISLIAGAAFCIIYLICYALFFGALLSAASL